MRRNRCPQVYRQRGRINGEFRALESRQHARGVEGSLEFGLGPRPQTPRDLRPEIARMVISRMVDNQRMNGMKVRRDGLDIVLAVPVHDIDRWHRRGKRLRRLAEIALKKGSEGERSRHHGFRRQQRRVGGVHIAEMDLSFVGDRRLGK